MLIIEHSPYVLCKISNHQTYEVGIVCWFSFPPLSLAAHFSDLSLPQSAPICVLCQLIQANNILEASPNLDAISFSLWLAHPLW